MTNVTFGVLKAISLIYKSVEYAMDPAFHDKGVNFVTDCLGFSYFLIWGLLYFTKFASYAHYSALTIPVLNLVRVSLVEFRWKDDMK